MSQFPLISSGVTLMTTLPVNEEQISSEIQVAPSVAVQQLSFPKCIKSCQWAFDDTIISKFTYQSAGLEQQQPGWPRKG
jgi:hypothetical protein